MSQIVIQSIVPILVLILGGIGWLYKHEKEKRVEVEKQLSERKYDVYIRLLTIFFDILKQVKKKQTSNDAELIDKMMDVKKDILIFGSDEVAYKFFTWEKYSQSKRNLKAFAELVIAVRKDMGNHNTKISTIDFLESLVKSNEDFKSLKEEGYILG